MRIRRIIRIVTVAAALAVIPGFAQPAADFDANGRRVSLKPISTSGFGGDGENGWTLTAVLAGMGLLCVGAFVTVKFMK